MSSIHHFSTFGLPAASAPDSCLPSFHPQVAEQSRRAPAAPPAGNVTLAGNAPSKPDVNTDALPVDAFWPPTDPAATALDQPLLDLLDPSPRAPRAAPVNPEAHDILPTATGGTSSSTHLLSVAPDRRVRAPLPPTLATGSEPAPALSSSTTGSFNNSLSAVDRAKKLAEDYTMSQLAKKRRQASGTADLSKRRKGLTGSSCSDDASELPQTESHRKYQKRLQKNRDSAFVSRIRRREYTRVLEESLTSVEKEKDVAEAKFMEMKRKFELVSAELSGIKQAAHPNLSTLRNVVASGLYPQNAVIDEQEHPTVQPQQQLLVHQQRSQPLRQSQPQSPIARPGTAVTMFMFAFMVGAVFPDLSHDKARSVSSGRFRFLQGFSLGALRGQFGKMKLPQVGFTMRGRGTTARRTGTVWGLGGGFQQQAAEYPTFRYSARMLSEVQEEGRDVLGERLWERFSEAAERYLEKLSQRELEEFDVLMKKNKDRSRAAGLRTLAKRVSEGRGRSDEKVMDEVVKKLDQLEGWA